MASEPIEKLEDPLDLYRPPKEPGADLAPSATPLNWLVENKTRLLQFCGVGASGVVVNLAVCNLAIYVLFTPWLEGDALFIAANILGFLVSVFTNFLFNDRWTWGDRQKGDFRHFLRRMSKYYLTASGAGLVQITSAWLSLTWFWATLDPVIFGFKLSPSLSILTGIGLGMIINFVASHLWAFRDAPPPENI